MICGLDGGWSCCCLHINKIHTTYVDWPLGVISNANIWIPKSVTLWYSLSEKKIREKNRSPFFFRELSFEATYLEDTFPVYYEGLLRALFSSLISRNFLEYSRGSDKVTVLSLIHISEPTRRTPISYAVFCLKKKNRGLNNMRKKIINNPKGKKQHTSATAPSANERNHQP